MSDTLKQLSKAIADSGKWKPRAGMACIDAKTGERWRRCGPFWFRCENGAVQWLRPELPTQSLTRALAAGPDLADEVTGLGLAADLPEHTLTCIHTADASRTVIWFCRKEAKGSRNAGRTRAEAIARAWLAAHGVEVPLC